MKKILLSTTLLIATAGVAAAEVTLSGSGRFGLVYSDTTAVNAAKTQISARLRFNVDAKFEADNGVTYGGRIRFQHSTGSTGAAFSPALLYVETNGFRVEVGNANSAYDSVALMYNPELGYLGRSFGDPLGSYYGFNSGPYSAAEANRVGIYVAYSISGLNLKASYIQPNQAVKTLPVGQDDETSIAADYTFGQITLAAAYAQSGNGIANNDLTFVGAAYAFSDVGNVGLNYNDNGTVGGVDVGKSITLYGNYKFGATTVGAYVTDLDVTGADTAFGIGASYDLGGATLAGSYQTGFGPVSDTFDLGVNFSF